MSITALPLAHLWRNIYAARCVELADELVVSSTDWKLSEGRGCVSFTSESPGLGRGFGIEQCWVKVAAGREMKGGRWREGRESQPTLRILSMF